MSFPKPIMILAGLLALASAPLAAPRAVAPAKAPAQKVTVWRESGDPVVGLSVSPTRVLLTEGSDAMWLYGTDGKLQVKLGPVDADSFRVFTYDSAISPDGQYALTANVDLGARLIDLQSSKVLTVMSGGMSRLNAVAYVPDGKHMAVATSTGFSVASAPARVYVTGFPALAQGAGSVEFSPDGALLAVGGEDKSVHVFRVADGSEVAAWNEHQGAVRALGWSPDGKKIASGSRDGAVRVWDVAAKTLLTSIAPGEGAVEDLAWSRDGAALAIATSPAGTESAARPSEPQRQAPRAAPDARPVVQLWNVKGATATPRRAIRGVYGARALAFLPSGDLLAGFADGRLASYPLLQIPTFAPAAPTGAATAPREDAQGMRELTGLAGGATALAWSRDGQLVAAGNAEAQIGVWNAQGILQRRITGHGSALNSLFFSPDGALLASGGEDRLQVARVADGQPVWNAPGRAVVAGWSPDGKSVYALVEPPKDDGKYPGYNRKNGLLRAWNAADGAAGPVLGAISYAMKAAISPDGAFVTADQGISRTYWDDTTLYVFATQGKPDAKIGTKTGDGSLRSMSGLHGRVNALRWVAPSRLLVDEGDYRDGHDDSQKPIAGKLGVRSFDPQTGAEQKAFLPFEMPIVALDENARGELAVAQDRVAVQVFDAKQREIASWPLPARSVIVKALAWSPDGKTLAIAIEGQPLRLWSVPRDNAR